MNATATKSKTRSAAVATAAKPSKKTAAQRVSKPLLSLVSDVQQFQGIAGPFAPFAGPDSLTFSGSLLGLVNSHGVNVPSLEDIPKDGVIEATDAAGHTWYIRCHGDWFVSAFRERTNAELAKLADQEAEHAVRMVPTYRFLAIRSIAFELMWIAEAMAPDQCPSRSARRTLKKRINALGQLQIDMLCNMSVSMSEVRERMEALALVFPYSVGINGKAVQA